MDRMKIKEEIDNSMESIKLDDEMKQKILNQTVRKKQKMNLLHMRRFSPVAAAVAGVLVIGSVTTMASGLIKWDSKVATIYQADEKQQEKLSQQGYSDVLAKKEENDVLSVSNNGITVTAKQTLADNQRIYIYLDVKSENGVKLTSATQVFDGWDILVDGEKQQFSNMNAGFVDDKYAHSDYERGYQIDIINENGLNLEGKTISIQLSNLMDQNKKKEEFVAVKGQWNLNWNVKSCSNQKTIPLNADVKVNGKMISLGELKVSPLSYDITYKQYTDSPEDELAAMNITFVMKDGKKSTTGACNVGPTEEKGALERVVDIDNIDKIIIFGKTFEMN